MICPLPLERLSKRASQLRGIESGVRFSFFVGCGIPPRNNPDHDVPNRLRQYDRRHSGHVQREQAEGERGAQAQHHHDAAVKNGVGFSSFGMARRIATEQHQP